MNRNNYIWVNMGPRTTDKTVSVSTGKTSESPDSHVFYYNQKPLAYNDLISMFGEGQFEEGITPGKNIYIKRKDVQAPTDEDFDYDHNWQYSLPDGEVVSLGKVSDDYYDKRYAKNEQEFMNEAQAERDYLNDPNRDKYFNFSQPAVENYILSQNNSLTPYISPEQRRLYSLQKLKEFFSWVPVVGEAIDLYDAGKNLYQGNYGEAALGLGLFVLPEWLEKGAKYARKGFGKLLDNTLYSNSAAGQYLRYGVGKFKYGFDALIPTLYRRINGRNTLPVSGSKTLITNPKDRFFYEDYTPSPSITNFTTDHPVMEHVYGDWRLADIYAIDGKALLGKNVVSTRPGDTFTFGDVIKVPTNKIRKFSGATDNPELFQKALSGDESAIVLYNKALVDKALLNTRRPTIKDYLFMDFVFLPRFKSDVVEIGSDPKKYPQSIIDIFTDSGHRFRLPQYNFKNVFYNPFPTVESVFRGERGIYDESDLLRGLHKYK